MSEPKWLSRELIENIHQQSIEVGGGSAGLRDPNLLDSAIAKPRNAYAYGETDIYQLASSYAEGLSRNHPFVDGNKRVAFAAADLFLLLNGKNLRPSKGDEHADMIEGLAQSIIDKSEAADHFKSYCEAIEKA